ncbi:MAG TPA: hypothetical protein VGM07_16650 [Stellaceae bacterium]|jgi:hypothetical protein
MRDDRNDWAGSIQVMQQNENNAAAAHRATGIRTVTAADWFDGIFGRR